MGLKSPKVIIFAISSFMFIKGVILTDQQCLNRKMPPGCYCESANLKIVICSEIPRTLPKAGETVTLQHTMPIIREPLFKTKQPHVKYLSLKSCHIKEINADAFQNFPNLEKLDLSSNMIYQLNDEAFKSLPKLKDLRLDHNHLARFPSRPLSYLSEINCLYLNNNLFRSVENSDIKFLKKFPLKVLSFHTNHIQCNCDLLYPFGYWILFHHIRLVEGEICKQGNTPKQTTQLTEIMGTCKVHQHPVIENVTTDSCTQVTVHWSYKPILNESDVLRYTIEWKTLEKGELPHKAFVTVQEYQLDNIKPGKKYLIRIIATVNGTDEKTSEQTEIVVSKFHSKNCMNIKDFGSEKITLEVLYQICALILVILLPVCAIVFLLAFCVLCMKNHKELNYFPEVVNPLSRHRNNAAALLGYPHGDGDSALGPVQIRQRFLSTPSLKLYTPDQIQGRELIYTGSFGNFILADLANEGNITILRLNRLSLRQSTQLASLCQTNHPNILNVLGAVKPSNINSDGISLLMDYLDVYLDLKTYLVQTKPNKRKLLRGGHPALNMLSTQLASGFGHLARRGLVHGDVAAHSVAVASNLQLKVLCGTGGDEGAHPDDYFQGRLPIRWMSPECIQYGSMTTHSDVWAFGVLLWELFTLGDLPYKNLCDTEVAANVVSKGSTLEFPRSCNKSLIELVKCCWAREPYDRITLPDLEDNLLRDVWNVSAMENCPTDTDATNTPPDSPNDEFTFFPSPPSPITRHPAFQHHLFEGEIDV